MAEWGFDEGGVLEALNRPFRTKVVETFKYGRKGSAYEGKIVEHSTTTDAWSMADVVAAAILAGLIVVGDDVVEEIKSSPELSLGVFGLSGLIAATIIKTGKESDASLGSIAAFLEGIFSFKGF